MFCTRLIVWSVWFEVWISASYIWFFTFLLLFSFGWNSKGAIFLFFFVIIWRIIAILPDIISICHDISDDHIFILICICFLIWWNWIYTKICLIYSYYSQNIGYKLLTRIICILSIKNRQNSFTSGYQSTVTQLHYDIHIGID